jgi:hypothetical protein
MPLNQIPITENGIHQDGQILRRDPNSLTLTLAWRRSLPACSTFLFQPPEAFPAFKEIPVVEPGLCAATA